jgi:hypothetical protein
LFFCCWCCRRRLVACLLLLLLYVQYACLTKLYESLVIDYQ